MVIIVIMVSGFLHIPSDGPLDYQTAFGTEREGERERGGKRKELLLGVREGGRGWIGGVRKREKGEDVGRRAGEEERVTKEEGV